MTKLNRFRWMPLIVGVAAGLAACSDNTASTESGDAVVSEAPKLGIRPYGDETIKIDMTKIKNEDLPKVFDFIDKNIDQHVFNLQKWVQQPSISNTGEGIPESAEMVKGFFDELGCQESRLYDTGITKWGQQGNPVVYAKCDEGAEKTVVIYMMYDTMPISQPDLWTSPPFEARLVEQAPFKKVLIGRGANNSKGRHMVQLNALRAIKAVTGKLPVNIIFVAEGDEERMSIGYNAFVTQNQELFKDADVMWGYGASEGCLFVELITAGSKWGRGPNYSNIHGGNKRSVDSPAWRHMQMLSKLTSPDGNRVLIPGFYDNIEPLTAAEDAELRRRAKGYDLKRAAEALGVERFITDDPYEYMKMSRMGTSMNLDGIWGGNMFPGGSGAILPNRIVSKHNFRYVPNMKGPDIAAKLRTHLDNLGYSDVEINIVGDVPWAKRSADNDFGRSNAYTAATFGMPFTPISSDPSLLMGGYWPAYLFSGIETDIDIPIGSVPTGSGGNSHAANEFFVIEGAGNTYGMAGAEKVFATALYNYAGLNGPIVLVDTPEAK